MKSVLSRFKLSSTERIMFLRWLPEALGSSGFEIRVYLVASTNLSLSDDINSPTYFSLVPSV